MPDEPQEQIQEQKRKKKQEEPKLAFEIGAVFGPGESKDELENVDLDMARFKASKGQAGTRTASGGGGSPSDYVHVDEAY